LSYQLAPIVILLALTAGTCGIAISVARDRERGLMKLFPFTTLRPAGEVVARVLTGTCVAFAASAIMLAISRQFGVVEVPAHRSPLLLATIALTTIAAAALGVLIARHTRRLVTTVGVAINLTVLLFLLGGGFSTIAFMPEPIQAMSRLLPTYYSVEAIREVMFYPELTDTATDLALLAAFAVAFMIAATVRRRPV
jgi:ABC-2 type transport system permease protein